MSLRKTWTEEEIAEALSRLGEPVFRVVGPIALSVTRDDRNPDQYRVTASAEVELLPLLPKKDSTEP